MAKVNVQALINLPQFDLRAGETGEIEIDDDVLNGRLALGHIARVGEDSEKSAPAPAAKPAPESKPDDGKATNV